MWAQQALGRPYRHDVIWAVGLDLFAFLLHNRFVIRCSWVFASAPNCPLSTWYISQTLKVLEHHLTWSPGITWLFYTCIQSQIAPLVLQLSCLIRTFPSHHVFTKFILLPWFPLLLITALLIIKVSPNYIYSEQHSHLLLVRIWNYYVII